MCDGQTDNSLHRFVFGGFFYTFVHLWRAVPLQCVPESPYDRGAVWAGDRFPLGAADVMQDIVASLHRHLYPGGSLCWVQWPGGSCQVLNMHVVFP